MAISAHFINNYRSLFPHIWHLKGFLKISLSFTWMLLARWLCFTFSAIWCFGEQTKTNVVTIWVRCSFPDNWTDTTHLFTKTLWVGQKLQNKKMNHRSRLNRFQNHFVLASKRFCCLGTHSGCASFMVTQYKIHVWFHSQDLNPTNGETVMTTSDEEAGERAVVSGASHSLTRVWTLGRLEAGCFYFHVLQHNNVYKMEFIWSEDTWEEHWSIAPPSPPRRRSTRVYRMWRQTQAECLRAIGSEWDPDVVTTAVHKSQSSSLTYHEGDGPAWEIWQRTSFRGHLDQP